MDFAKRTCPPSASGAQQPMRMRTSQLPHPGGHPTNDIERLTSSIPTKDAVEAYKSSAKWSGASITIQSNKPNKPQQPPSSTPQPTSSTRCNSSTSSSSSPPSSSRSSLPAPSSSARMPSRLRRAPAAARLALAATKEPRSLQSRRPRLAGQAAY
ncbi:hypothetical protein VTO73DRAFT_6843 [Trametes versicolor]